MNKDEIKRRVLFIEDDPAVAQGLQRMLEEDYAVEVASTAEEGLVRAEASDFDVLITDLQMPGLSGLDVIMRLHPSKPHLPIILLTGHHTTETAIEAIKLGAFDYVLKPITNPREFVALIGRAAAAGADKAKGVTATGRKQEQNAIVGRSRPMQIVYKEIGRIAARPVTVLIRGETGTGKELVARALHQHSDRADQPFIIVNCVAIPETLLESELFGHEQGAFTGAQARRIGKFERANHGTLFLDEIGDMAVNVQSKLLRVLQEKTFQRVGGKETISVDVRIIAATHRDLEGAVEQKKFREDLYYRLGDAVIHLPPLRERRGDIPDLVEYFLNRFRAESGPDKPIVTPEAVRFLQFRSWKGNVRELKNLIQRALILAHGYPITPELIRQALAQPNLVPPQTSQTIQSYISDLLLDADREQPTGLAATVSDWVEREVYGQAIRLAEGDQTKVAQWLGVSRPTVRERLVRYNLDPSVDRSSTA